MNEEQFIQQFKEKASNRKKANKKYLEKLKRLKPKNLDDSFHAAHEEVFEEIDCLKCANCCKTTSPIFRDKDIDTLAKKLRLKPSQFVEKYLHLDEDRDYVLNFSPCPFLGADNYCSVYNDRPLACREYPHTNRKKMFQIMDLTFQNTLVCPATLEIIEKIKEVIPE